MSNLFILLWIVSQEPSVAATQDVSNTVTVSEEEGFGTAEVIQNPIDRIQKVSKYKFGTGVQFSLLSSFLPCLAVRYWMHERFGIQLMMTALTLGGDDEEQTGVFYTGGRAIFRVFKKESKSSPIAPYLGVGAGFRKDNPDSLGGIGGEVFSGIEWFPYSFISFNADFGVRYTPESLMDTPWRIGVGGGLLLYFF